MPTTGTVDGNVVGIFVDDTLIACATSATLDLSTNMTDSTCKDNNGQEQVKPAQKTWGMSLDGMFAFDSAYGWVDLFEAWEGGTLLTLKWGTDVVGDTSYSGEAYIESLSASAPVNEVVTYNVSFKGTGVITATVNT